MGGIGAVNRNFAVSYCILRCIFFYVLLTVHLSIILATDQLNAQVLVLKYVYYILLHVSSTVVLIIRRSSCAPDGHLQCVTIPDAV